jgi:hypothetical protein
MPAASRVWHVTRPKSAISRAKRDGAAHARDASRESEDVHLG